MKKFTNVSLLSTFFAIGGVATALVTATPAQAQAQNLVGNLSWSNGTSDFFSDVDFVNHPDFTVNFSPNPDNVTLINSASGVFVPPFTAVPPAAPYTENLTTQAVGTFKYFETLSENRHVYKSTNPISFNFTNGVNVTWGEGTQVVGQYDDPASSVQFQLLGPSTTPTITNNGVPLLGAATDVLEFGDSVDPAPGSYNGVVDATIPEPTTILGSLVALGMGAKLKRKKGSVEPK